ncbi:MAG: hypothetical protein ACFNKE_06895, partial [Neisseria elongata]
MQPDFSRPVLAVDTGTSFLSLALQTGGRILSRHTDAGNKQSDLILPQIGGLFAEAGITAADLGAVVYNCGPGEGDPDDRVLRRLSHQCPVQGQLRPGGGLQRRVRQA